MSRALLLLPYIPCASCFIVPFSVAHDSSIGDYELKTPPALLTCEPEVTVRTLVPGDVCLVLACDGVWDVLTDREVAALALAPEEQVADAPAPSVESEAGAASTAGAACFPSLAAGRIVAEAHRRGSTDNITAVVVAVNWSTTETGKAHSV